MDITITKLDGESRSLTVQPHMTVGDLKSLVCQHLNVPTAKQKLSTENGHKIILGDDSKRLSDYGLHSGCVVRVLITEPGPIQVFVKNEKGQTKTYDIQLGETVTQFKAKVHNKERVPVDQMRLIHNGRQMDDGRKLEDYGVKTHSTIQLTLRLRGG